MALRKFNTHQIINIPDYFSYGPLSSIEMVHLDERLNWMEQVISDVDLFDSYSSKMCEWDRRLTSIPANETVVLWAMENAHEQIGLRYVIHKLKSKALHIQIPNVLKALENLMNTEDVTYTFSHCGEIMPDYFLPIMNNFEPEILLSQDKEIYSEDWLQLINENGTLRTLENGEIKTVPEDYFDEYIVKKAIF